MSILRKDDRHNEDLVGQIADTFTRAVNASAAAKQETDEGSGTGEPAPEPSEQPAFVVTGDRRAQSKKRR
ncbi:hypothetical protein BAY61_04005 [Prauserella marina]|uniref:Uncharacterized protein n=1 Tax=Prauserella marina TaxID=530584 RepID=A0A222VKR1_9PSEU|nr:hypothetical protein [Prauserella marina]ASR34291.1 hypothetical protein BAY61_04005 [Prauserella marina]PWV71931.1 hypothetical protein DES30_111102 [Prauserella marina]SDD91210.1 hypothetical protein SAMN05421630_114101 [Prauserella marina]